MLITRNKRPMNGVTKERKANIFSFPFRVREADFSFMWRERERERERERDLETFLGPGER